MAPLTVQPAYLFGKAMVVVTTEPELLVAIQAALDASPTGEVRVARVRVQEVR